MSTEPASSADALASSLVDPRTTDADGEADGTDPGLLPATWEALNEFSLDPAPGVAHYSPTLTHMAAVAVTTDFLNRLDHHEDAAGATPHAHAPPHAHGALPPGPHGDGHHVHNHDAPDSTLLCTGAGDMCPLHHHCTGGVTCANYHCCNVCACDEELDAKLEAPFDCNQGGESCPLHHHCTAGRACAEHHCCALCPESEFLGQAEKSGYEKARDRLRNKLKSKDKPASTTVTTGNNALATLSVDALVDIIESGTTEAPKKKKKKKKKRNKKKRAEAAAAAKHPGKVGQGRAGDSAAGAGAGAGAGVGRGTAAAAGGDAGAGASSSGGAPGASAGSRLDHSGSGGGAAGDGKVDAARLQQAALAGMRVESIKEQLARGHLDDVDVDKLFNEAAFEDDDDEVDAELEAFRQRLQLA